ncbi:MAG TPA: adenylate/guanylate cyclase domain-containing protein, partial [Burkholderiales bacterium]|nr:adenylate/guanylate cyclase domain-containing protein [Burkholderiales bacterium]
MKRTLPLLALAALVLGGLELFGLHALRGFENRLLDSFVRSQAAKLAPDPEIVFVDVDEKSLARMEQEAGRWPWPRVVHAELIEGLAAQKPRAIVFDMNFAEPDIFRRQDDAAFAETVAQHRNTYFGVFKLPLKREADGVRLAELAADLHIDRQPGADPNARAGLIPPLILRREDWRAGLISFIPDEDGVGRRYLLRDVIGGWRVPSLPVRVAADLGYAVPDADDMVLAWRGGARSFPHVSYSDLYEDFNRSKRTRPADEFAGKIVIVGTAATGLQDLRVTPIESVHPGGEILGTAIENLKNDRHMRYASPAWAAAIAILLIVLLFIGFRAQLDARVLGGALALASAGLLWASYQAAGALLLAPALTPLAAAWTFYAAAALADYLQERHARRQAIAQFSRFVNPHVVKQLLERGGLEGAGQTREVSVLFSDIRGFTTLSETKAPAEVVALLNDYFSRQVDVVFRHGGSLDKFIGDCIMALWGAPLDDAEHARHAVACALDMADTLQAFKHDLGAADASFDVGIGIHSGPAVVGLIGSDRRREYTAI